MIFGVAGREPRDMKMIRNRRGSAIIEGAAALVMMLPVLMVILFVTIETSIAFLIQTSLAQGAREDARNLAIAYAQHPDIVTNTSEQQACCSNIKIVNIIGSPNQFTAPTFQTTTQPYTVSATVNYTSGMNGCPIFPNPDPLHLSSKFKLQASSTYRLE